MLQGLALCIFYLQRLLNEINWSYWFEAIALEIFDVASNNIVASLSLGDSCQKGVFEFLLASIYGHFYVLRCGSRRRKDLQDCLNGLVRELLVMKLVMSDIE